MNAVLASFTEETQATKFEEEFFGKAAHKRNNLHNPWDINFPGWNVTSPPTDLSSTLYLEVHTLLKKQHGVDNPDLYLHIAVGHDREGGMVDGYFVFRNACVTFKLETSKYFQYDPDITHVVIYRKSFTRKNGSGIRISAKKIADLLVERQAVRTRSQKIRPTL